MNVRTRKRTLYEFRDENGTVTVEFIPIPKDLPAPGFSHRVHVTGYVGFKTDWLGDEWKPNSRNARFYYRKFTAPKGEPV